MSRIFWDDRAKRGTAVRSRPARFPHAIDFAIACAEIMRGAGRLVLYQWLIIHGRALGKLFAPDGDTLVLLLSGRQQEQPALWAPEFCEERGS
jgi:hypothetical protein